MTDLVWAHVVRDTDRSRFKQCRRAWDLGARSRRNLVPAAPAGPPDLDRAVRDALAVYYFPGMWEWDREIVVPLAVEAFTRSLRMQRGRDERSRTRRRRRRDVDDTWAEAAAVGERLLHGYFAWAPTVDDFTPVRVEADFEFDVPDADRPEVDLLARDGRAIRFRGRVDMLVIDADDAYWLVDHRVVDAWSDSEQLVLDERGVDRVLGMGAVLPRHAHRRRRLQRAARRRRRAAGRRRPARRRHPRAHGTARSSPHGRTGGAGSRPADHPGRGARVPPDPDPACPGALERMGAQLAAEALEMTDDGLALFPHPTRANCSQCEFRRPCIAMNEGADAEALLAAGFRERGPELEEGRLGGVTWSMNRGAVPPRFGGRR